MVPAFKPDGLLAESLLTPGGVGVLMVADNHDSADSLAMLLEIDGCEVLKADDGELAIAVAKESGAENCSRCHAPPLLVRLNRYAAGGLQWVVFPR